MTIRHYGSATTVAFDGWEEESPIKDYTHQKGWQTMYTVISLTAETDLSDKKEEFLSRGTNKQRLIPINWAK